MKNQLKKIGGLSLVLLLVSTLQSFTPYDELAGAKMAWVEMEYDFGSIEQGSPVSHDFEFTNNGEAPLVINNVKTSCGCTVPNYPKDPIMPGESEMIKVTYNAAKVGSFNKKITVMSNADQSTYSLAIAGEVLGKK
jgi:hypothetical protein